MQIINKKKGNIEDAQAVYYWISSLIMLEDDGENDYSREIKQLLKLFFTREGLDEEKSDSYSSIKISEDVKDFQKIKAYLCEVDDDHGENYQDHKYCK